MAVVTSNVTKRTQRRTSSVTTARRMSFMGCSTGRGACNVKHGDGAWAYVKNVPLNFRLYAWDNTVI